MFRDEFWLSLLLTVPVVLWSMDLQEWFGYTAPAFPGSDLDPRRSSARSFSSMAGWSSSAAPRELRDRQPGMMTLISLAIVVAFFTSAGLGPSVLRGRDLVGARDPDHDHAPGALARDAVDRPSRGALAALAELLPDTAERVTEDGTEVSPARSPEGDVVLVRPGARVPGRRARRRGEADVDESLITGESRPVPKAVGDGVIAGAVAPVVSLRVRVAAGRRAAALSGIMRMVAAAQASASRAQALADRAAALLFWVALVAGAITLVVWWLLGDPEGRSCGRRPSWLSPARMPSAWPSLWSSPSGRRSVPGTACSSRTGSP